MNDLIKAIHAGNDKCVVAVTGGGASAVAALLAVPGASNTILEALVPYSDGSLQDFLGFKPVQSCSSRTARELAMAAWLRAKQLANTDHNSDELYGIGCTAAFSTNRDRRGDDRCHVAVQGSGITLDISLSFDKDMYDRAAEEAVACDMILSALGYVVGVSELIEPPPGVDVVVQQEKAPTDWQALMSGEANTSYLPRSPAIVFPGAFNPVHQGHLDMAAFAARKLDAPAILEISIKNVDKPSIDFVEMANRQRIVNKRIPIVFTNAPTFAEKAEIFPGATFLVGADTIERIAQPRYYNNSIEVRDMALATIARQGCRFLVFGRQQDDKFVQLHDLTLPDALAAICEGVPETDFRQDISSSEIRSKT